MKVKIKKKKGNSLIETVAAIAILIIGLEAVLMAYSTSSKIWQNENKKLDTSTFNQTICQNIRGKKKVEVEGFYNLKKTPASDYVNAFIYFDDYTDLVGTGEDLGDVRKQYGAIGDETSYAITEAKSESDQEVLYKEYLNECKAKNTDKKKYGALIEIVDDREINPVRQNSRFSIYKIKVTVWNLKDSGSYQAQSSFFVGG